jgi:hypothetical protein
VHDQFDVSVTGLLTAVQELLPDLKQEQGAVLVANGPIALNGEPFDNAAAEYGSWEWRWPLPPSTSSWACSPPSSHRRASISARSWSTES